MPGNHEPAEHPPVPYGQLFQHLDLQTDSQLRKTVRCPSAACAAGRLYCNSAASPQSARPVPFQPWPMSSFLDICCSIAKCDAFRRDLPVKIVTTTDEAVADTYCAPTPVWCLWEPQSCRWSFCLDLSVRLLSPSVT